MQLRFEFDELTAPGDASIALVGNVKGNIEFSNDNQCIKVLVADYHEIAIAMRTVKPYLVQVQAEKATKKPAPKKPKARVTTEWKQAPDGSTFAILPASAPFISTCLNGEFTADYARLLAVLGDPTYPTGDDYKTDIEWVLDTPLGRATVYNYKDGKNYCGREGTPTHKLTDWHVGGETARNMDRNVAEYVANLLK